MIPNNLEEVCRLPEGGTASSPTNPPVNRQRPRTPFGKATVRHSRAEGHCLPEAPGSSMWFVTGVDEGRSWTLTREPCGTGRQKRPNRKPAAA